MLEKDYPNLSLISEIIGGDITPARIQKVIYLSNKEGFLVHGIKDYANLSGIRQNGISPLSPEGGYVSYWTSGARIFTSSSQGALMTYDTSFFHYGHTYSQDLRFSHMLMAVARIGDLKSLGQVDFLPDSLVILNFPVPRSDLSLMRVVLDREGTDFTPREYGRMMEKGMFELMEELFRQGYQKGEERVLFKKALLEESRPGASIPPDRKLRA